MGHDINLVVRGSPVGSRRSSNSASATLSTAAAHLAPGPYGEEPRSIRIELIAPSIA
jgi:hypothetical protein